MHIQIKPHVANFIAPKRGTAQAAGLDVFAQQDIVITEDTQMIDLGFRAAVPQGYAAVLLPRSGSGAKFNVQLSNTLGLIDSDYRGPWMAAIHLGGKGTKADEMMTWGQHLASHYQSGSDRYEQALENTTKALEFKRGEAIGQMIFIEVPLFDVVVCDATTELPETDRGEGGFGSTDKPRS